HASILALAPRPTTIVATRELYGGTAALLRMDLEPAGYEIAFVDLTDLNAFGHAVNTAGLVIAETITNPLCGVPDIEAIASMGQREFPRPGPGFAVGRRGRSRPPPVAGYVAIVPGGAAPVRTRSRRDDGVRPGRRSRCGAADDRALPAGPVRGQPRWGGDHGE